MKRIVISLVAVAAIGFCGMFASKAEAHHPHFHHHHHHGHHHHGHHHHHGVRIYSGYAPYGVYRPVVIPYGAGYYGGYQPYQGIIVQQPRFGVSIGF